MFIDPVIPVITTRMETVITLLKHSLNPFIETSTARTTSTPRTRAQHAAITQCYGLASVQRNHTNKRIKCKPMQETQCSKQCQTFTLSTSL